MTSRRRGDKYQLLSGEYLLRPFRICFDETSISSETILKILYSYFYIGSQRNDVAFTAVTSSTTTYSTGSTIAFNTLKNNYGNAFNSGNYRFTAPSEGLYVFSWSIATHTSYYGNTRLMKNGSVYHQLNCQSSYQQCGATVTMWLKRNDQVWVASGYSSIYVYATHSSFSGWKIH